jgi:hypothetical protein
MSTHKGELSTMQTDVITPPPDRDLPSGELARRRQHLVSEARATLEGYHSQQVRSGRTGGRHLRLLALGAAFVVAVVLSIPALGVGPSIVSLFAGGHDPDAPVPTASDVLIASGEAGVPWKILATRSDQGLCLDLFHRAGDDRFGGGGCGFTNIRGDLPPDLRGNPATKCIATPEGPLVPCGSLPRRWIELWGGGGSIGLERSFSYGPLAEEVASVEFVLTDGQRVHANVVERPGGLPLNVYWATWPCRLRSVSDGPYAEEGLKVCVGGPEMEMVIARDAEGRVLERRVPVWNGNPTGDPNGPAPPSRRTQTP